MTEAFGLSKQQLKGAMHTIDFQDHDIACLGAGIGVGYFNMQELHALSYCQALNSVDKLKWVKSMDEEHDRMLKHEVGDNEEKGVPKWCMGFQTNLGLAI